MVVTAMVSGGWSGAAMREAGKRGTLLKGHSSVAQFFYFIKNNSMAVARVNTQRSKMDIPAATQQTLPVVSWLLGASYHKRYQFG